MSTLASSSLSLRTGAPSTDSGLVSLIDTCFERPTHESRLLEVLDGGCPDFDPGLSLIAEHEDASVGWALFLPRTARLRGQWLRLGVAAPIGVVAPMRGQGVGHFLMRAGLDALRDRGICAAVTLGAPEFFAQFGFAPAFDLYTVVARRADLPEGEDSPGWRGLTAPDIPHLSRLLAACYAEVPGTERRTEAVMDWESSIAEGHTLVLEIEGRAVAYLRFRVRDGLQVLDCGVESRAAVEGVLRLLKRLMNEHGRNHVEVHVPPPHPLARALFHRGAQCRHSNFGGGAMLCVLDWPGLLGHLAPNLSSALDGGGPDAISLELDGQMLRLARAGQQLSVEPGREANCHLAVPAGWGPGLFTGQRSHCDLLGDPEVIAGSTLDEGGLELVRRLFPVGFPRWMYSPAFELADR